MAKTIVALTDTFNSFKNKVNDISNDIGDITLLTTSVDSDVVGALNQHEVQIGDNVLTGLSATNLSAGVRELRVELGNHSTLTTTVTSNVVGAVNELDGEIGTLSSLVTAAKTNLVSAINEVHNHTTTDVAEGTNLYYSDGRFDTRLATKSTTNLGEGTNLYHTTTRARSSVSATNSGTGFGTLSYSSATGVITFSKVTSADIRAQFTAGVGINIVGGEIRAVNLDSASISDNSILSRHIVNGAIVGEDISGTAALNVASIQTSGNATILGNLTVSGTTTYLNTATLNVGDNIIVLNADVTGVPSENGGIEVERGTSANTLVRWNETTDRWGFTNDGTTYYNIPLTTEYDNYGSWTIRDGDTTSYTITSADTLQIASGTGITSNFTADDVLTLTNTDLGSSQNIFKNVAVSGQSTVVADNNNDTLTIVGGTNVTVTTNATTDTITFSSTDTNTTYTATDGLDLVGTAFGIANNGVTTARILNSAVTIAKLNTAVSLIIYNSVGTALKTVTGPGA